MTRIQLTTAINAPPKTCFDLARSIDLHQSSMAHSNEKAVAGRTKGLIQKGESVTWEATHFFVRQRLSSKITEMDEPRYFVDEMISGAFQSLWHRHEFVPDGHQTIMTDDFRYEVPFGMAGKLFDKLVLRNYLTNLLETRNQVIKKMAESAASSE